MKRPSTPCSIIDTVCFNWTDEQIAENRPGMRRTPARSEVPRKRGFSFWPVSTVNRWPMDDCCWKAARLIWVDQACCRNFEASRSTPRCCAAVWKKHTQRGYHVAAINAEPLSRPIVAKYGFKEYARIYIYGWMPVIDVDVIKSLVPQ